MEIPKIQTVRVTVDKYICICECGKAFESFTMQRLLGSLKNHWKQKHEGILPYKGKANMLSQEQINDIQKASLK